MNINNILKINKLRMMRLSQNQKNQYGHVVCKDRFVIFTTSRFPYAFLCLNSMTVQTSIEKVSHIYKELIRRIMTLEYKKLLLLKSHQNKVASNIVTTEKNKKSQTYHLC